MRHIHVELVRKEPAQAGGDPGLQGAGPRPFSQEELRLQKVYQLSIFSQRGGFSEGRASLRPGIKRPLQDEEDDNDEEEDLEGEVLCGASPGSDVHFLRDSETPRSPRSPRSPPLSPTHTHTPPVPGRRPTQRNLDRPVPDACTPLSPKSPPMLDPHSPRGSRLCHRRGPLEEAQQGNVAQKRPLQDEEVADDEECDGEVSRDFEMPRSPRSPSLSPTHAPPVPGRRLTQRNLDRPVLDAFAPLSPKSSPMLEPQALPHSFSPWGISEGSPPPAAPRTEASTAGDDPPWSVDGSREEGCSNYDQPGEVPMSTSCTLELQGPSRPRLTPAEAVQWGASLESSPPPPDRRAHPSSPPSWSNGTSPTDREKSPSETPRAVLGVKKKLLSSSDTGDSCSEDEGPSTSKRSRLALLTPGLGLAAGRSTDSKAAPYWTHLLPTAREQGKSPSECSRSSRRLKAGSRLKSRQLRSGRRTDTSRSCSSSSLASISRALLGNFEESILKGRFSPSGRIEGFTAEIGASGSYCPQHATLPVQVTYYDTSEHSAPSPFLGVISLEPLGKKGYSVPKAGTIQVTLFNPNKTVVKMFLVTYNFGDMPVNHMTFLRHRIFLVPVEEGEGSGEGPESSASDRKKILCYLMHLRFQSSKSGKIYLHNDIRLLFSRKSIEVDTGIPYELKSFTEVPRNPKYSPRV
ncbi:protein FAM214B [Pygocentrus nattereri]|uniref:protein FAM214B n=1 Tax=Pygocentrus nattereri TaxID=42514 RepID=UPI001891499E|nr:protein FAM214B [Pygocentrus nattereri]